MRSRAATELILKSGWIDGSRATRTRSPAAGSGRRPRDCTQGMPEHSRYVHHSYQHRRGLVADYGGGSGHLLSLQKSRSAGLSGRDSRCLYAERDLQASLEHRPHEGKRLPCEKHYLFAQPFLPLGPLDSMGFTAAPCATLFAHPWPAPTRSFGRLGTRCAVGFRVQR